MRWRTKKMAPENRGHDRRIAKAGIVRAIASVAQKVLYFAGLRDRSGAESPLRMAMRLLAVRRRSMEAIRRPNRVLEAQ